MNEPPLRSQYGVRPKHGPSIGREGAPYLRSRGSLQGEWTDEDWLDTVYARQSLEESIRQEAKDHDERESPEFKNRMEHDVQEATSMIIKPQGRNDEEHCPAETVQKHMDRKKQMIDACLAYPEPENSRGVYEYHNPARDEGDSTTAISIETAYSPTHCALLRTFKEEEVIEKIKSYPFTANIEGVKQGEIEPDSEEGNWLKYMITLVRILAGEDAESVCGEALDVEDVSMPNFEDPVITDEIKQEMGKNIIIAGNGYHPEHDRIFVFNQVEQKLQSKMRFIIRQARIHIPSVLLKQGIVIVDTPGTMDSDPLKMYETIKQISRPGDVLVPLSNKTFNTSGVFKFLRDHGYFRKMLLYPEEHQMLPVFNLNEQNHRCNAKKLLEAVRCSDPDRRAILESRRKNNEKIGPCIQSQLKTTYQTTRKPTANGFSNTHGLTEEEKLHIGNFDRAWREKYKPMIFGSSEDDVKAVAILPLLYTSLSLNLQPDGISWDDRKLALEESGGSKLLECIGRMTEDAPGDAMRSLAARFQTHLNQPVASLTVQGVFNAEQATKVRELASKTWKRKEDPLRDDLPQQCDVDLAVVYREKHPRVEEVFQEIEQQMRLGCDAETVLEEVREIIERTKPSKIVNNLRRGGEDIQYRQIPFMRVFFDKGFNEQHHEKMKELAEEIKTQFKQVMLKLLVKLITNQISSSQSASRARSERDSELNKRVEECLQAWFDKEFSDESGGMCGVAFKTLNFDKKNKLTNLWTSICCDALDEHLCRPTMELVKGKIAWATMRGKFRTLMSLERVEKVLNKAVEDFVKESKSMYLAKMKDFQNCFVRNYEETRSDMAQRRKENAAGPSTRNSPSRAADARKGPQTGRVTGIVKLFRMAMQELVKYCPPPKEPCALDVQERSKRLDNILTAFVESISEGFPEQDRDMRAKQLCENVERHQIMRYLQMKNKDGLPLEQKKQTKKLPNNVKELVDSNPPIRFHTEKELFLRAGHELQGYIKANALENRRATSPCFEQPAEDFEGKTLLQTMLEVIGHKEPGPDKCEQMCRWLVQYLLVSSGESQPEYIELLGDEDLPSWSQRMVKDMGGDLLLVEAFCNYYKVNCYVFSTSTCAKDRPLYFPAFRPHGADHVCKNPALLVHLRGSTFSPGNARRSIGFNGDVKEEANHNVLDKTKAVPKPPDMVGHGWGAPSGHGKRWNEETRQYELVSMQRDGKTLVRDWTDALQDMGNKRKEPEEAGDQGGSSSGRGGSSSSKTPRH